jgi:hypothetical protein
MKIYTRTALHFHVLAARHWKDVSGQLNASVASCPGKDPGHPFRNW